MSGTIESALAFNDAIPDVNVDLYSDNLSGVVNTSSRLMKPLILAVISPCIELIFTFNPHIAIVYPPANTLDDPVATLVQPDIASPILPHPLLLIKTVDDPDAIGAA